MSTWIAEHLVRLVDCSHLRLAATLVGVSGFGGLTARDRSAGGTEERTMRYAQGLLNRTVVGIAGNTQDLVVVLLLTLLEQLLGLLHPLVDLERV